MFVAYQIINEEGKTVGFELTPWKAKESAMEYQEKTGLKCKILSPKQQGY